MLIESPAFLSSKQSLRHSKALSAFSNEWLPSTLHNSRQHLITYCASVSASILLGGDDLAQHVFYFPCGTSVVPGGEGGCPIRRSRDFDYDHDGGNSGEDRSNFTAIYAWLVLLESHNF